jgi:transposase-like protein
MERRRFTREFKLEAVKLTKERSVAYAQAARDLGVHQTVLRNWVKGFEADPQHSFPGHGQMKPEQLEIARLKREVTRLKAERDILINTRRCFSSCGHRNWLRYVLSAPEGSGRWLFGAQPRKKTWSMGCCGLESGDAVERSRLGN